jgi:hypothetical protein
MPGRDGGGKILMEAHVSSFNRAVQSGDYTEMLSRFADDAELVFEGVPAGPFRGRDAIARAYAEQPPDDTVSCSRSSTAIPSSRAIPGAATEESSPAACFSTSAQVGSNGSS